MNQWDKQQGERAVDSELKACNFLERKSVIQTSMAHFVHLDGDSAQTLISQCNEAEPIFFLSSRK